MSATLLTRLKNHLSSNSLLTGYDVRYFRWTDADAAGNTPFILFRQSGGGDSNLLLQDIQVSIVLVQNPTGATAGDTRMQSIIRLLRDETTSTGIVRFDPVGAVRGPMYLENGRPVFELPVRCYTVDL